MINLLLTQNRKEFMKSHKCETLHKEPTLEEKESRHPQNRMDHDHNDKLTTPWEQTEFNLVPNRENNFQSDRSTPNSKKNKKPILRVYTYICKTKHLPHRQIDSI